MIRLWQKEDNAAVCELEKECFPDPWNIDMIDSCVRSGNFYGLVDERDGKIAGYIGSIFDLWEGEILLVAVREEYRRNGIGRALLSGVLERYERAGKEAVYLEVRKSNLAAQSLYYSLGFEKIAVREKYYQNTEDALVLKKSFKG